MILFGVFYSFTNTEPLEEASTPALEEWIEEAATEEAATEEAATPLKPATGPSELELQDQIKVKLKQQKAARREAAKANVEEADFFKAEEAAAEEAYEEGSRQRTGTLHIKINIQDSLMVKLTCDGGFSGRGRLQGGKASISSVPVDSCMLSIVGRTGARTKIKGGGKTINCTYGTALSCR